MVNFLDREGYSGYDLENGYTFVDDVAILDMDSWQWVDSIAPQESSSDIYQDPGCRFAMPHMPDNSSDGGDDGLPYDPTVVSNPNRNDDHVTKAIGISLGVAGFLLCLGVALFFIRRQRKNARMPSPRWVPKPFARFTKGNSTASKDSGFDGFSMDDCSSKRTSASKKSILWSFFSRKE